MSWTSLLSDIGFMNIMLAWFIFIGSCIALFVSPQSVCLIAWVIAFSINCHIVLASVHCKNKWSVCSSYSPQFSHSARWFKGVVLSIAFSEVIFVVCPYCSV